MIRRNIFLILLMACLIPSSNIYANTIDSLLIELDKGVTAFQEAKIYNELASLIDRSNIHQSQEYAEMALAISEDKGFVDEKHKAKGQIAYMKLLQGEIDTCISIINSSLENEHEKITQESRAKLLHILGLAYQLQGDYSNSLLNYHKALQINEETGAKQQILRQLNNMSLVRRELKDYDIAFDYLEQSTKLAKELKDSAIMLYSEVNKAYVFLDQEKYEEALKYAEPIISNPEFKIDTFDMSAANNILGQIYLGLENYPLAKEYADKALYFGKVVDYHDGVVHAKYTRSYIKFQYGQFEEAKNEALKAIEIAGDKTATRYFEGLLKIVSDSYSKLGNHKQASFYKDKLIAVKESIFNVEKEALAYKMDIDFQTKKKEAENSSLRSKVALNDELISKQSKMNILISILALFGLLLGFIMYQLWKARKQEAEKLEIAVSERTSELKFKNEELLQANEEIKQFAYVVSHDLKEPLRNIISFNGLLQQKFHANPELKDYTGQIEFAAEQQKLLIDTILEFSNIRNIQLKEVESFDANLVIQKALNEFPIEDQQKVKLDIDSGIMVKGHDALILLVFKKLISNALIYTKSENPKVEISTQVFDEYVEFRIRDNGIGIDKKYHEDIFNMFTRLNARSEFIRSGLGLATAKKIVNAHHGQIWIESKKDEGSDFYFTLKKSQ